MKKLLLLLAILGMVAVGCTGPEGEDVPGNEDVPGGEDYLTFINNTNVNPTMVAGGGMVNITFTTEYDWTITTNVDWLSTSETNGFGGTVDFFITASANKTDKERKGIVTITLDDVDKEYKIRVTQEPNEGIKHLVCQANEILYTTKYNYVIEKDFADMTGFGDTDATYCVDYGYDGTYGYIRFNNDVTKIPDNAFAGCASVETIYLPDGVKEIGEGVFAGCSALRYIVSNNSTDDFSAIIIDGCLCAFALAAELTTYTIPSSVTSILSGVFKSCKKIESIRFNHTTPPTLGRKVFKDTNIKLYVPEKSLYKYLQEWDASNIEHIVYPDAISKEQNSIIYTTSDNVPLPFAIGYGVIKNNMVENVGVMVLDSSITTIEAQCFANLENLTTIMLPNSITTIDEEAFYNCSKLTTVIIPDSVTSIGNHAFFNCTSLTSVTIPDSVTWIGGVAFYNCSSLTSVTIPDSVTSIGNSVFCDCSSLKEVYCKPTTPPTGGAYMFHYNASGRKIYVPRASVDAYKYASWWSDYSSDIVGYDF